MYRIIQIIFTILTVIIIHFFVEIVMNPTDLEVKSNDFPFYFLCGFAVLSNIGIIYYHATTPPHPKFLMTKIRKFWVRVHAISGSLELIIGIIAWSLNHEFLAMIVGFTALFFHVPSAFFQSKGSFGAKGITVPSYYMIVTIHAYFAFRLITSGGQIYWLEQTWITLQAYAYMRIFMVLLENLKVFKGSHYTVTELFAGAVITSYLFGGFGPILIVIGILIYLAMYKLLMKPSKEEMENLFAEKERESLIDTDTRNFWISNNLEINVSNGDEDMAEKIFSKLDKDDSGYLSYDEVVQVSRDWGLKEKYVEATFTRFESSKGLNLNDFKNTLWRMGNYKLIKENGTEANNPKEKATTVFKHLDLDSSGYLEIFEIELLLMEWGLEPKEAKEYMLKYAGSDKKIDFDEFFTQMKPIWSFGFQQLYS